MARSITLSLEQFERLCAAIQVPEQSGDERRRTTRVEARAPVTVALAEGTTLAAPTTSTLRDVSPRGGTLSHPKPVPPGTRLVIFLGTDSEPIRVVASVVHCKCFADGQSLIGLEFENFIDPSSKPRKTA